MQKNAIFPLSISSFSAPLHHVFLGTIRKFLGTLYKKIRARVAYVKKKQ